MQRIRSWASAIAVAVLCAIAAPASGQSQDADDPFSPKNMAAPPKAEPPAAPFTAPAERPPTADRIDITASLTPESVRRGETVKLVIQATPRPGFHTYPLTQRTPDEIEEMLSSLKLTLPPGLQALPPVTEEPPPEFVHEGKSVLLEYTGPFTWSQEILVTPDATPGEKQLRATVRVQVCDSKCVWGEHPFELSFRVSDTAAVPLSADISERMNAAPLGIKVVPAPSDSAASLTGGAKKAGDSGLIAFMLTGVFWGAVSLITPCVFPMIPITVSFFLKQSEKQHHRPLTMASVYCATIIVVLTIAAVALLSMFREFSVSPGMNFGLGALFIYFALSLFGMYEIELPSGLARFTSAREGQGGLLGTMFMALTFTIISFACVAPFLGGFGATGANSGITWLHRVLGGVAFAATFAAPFFILAVFPTLLKKMPKSGNWLNAVKVVMGFLELAAAIKFFRAGEQVFLAEPTLFTYEFCLGLYVALSILCGLYLLSLYRLPHDTPAEHLPVPQLMVSLLFLGLGLYLTPALFKNSTTGENFKPAGVVFAWIDSFLLPDTKSNLPWVGDLNEGLQKGLKDHRLVFVDFTGVTCTNCKYNEENVFPRKEIHDSLVKYSLVQLYTDKVPNFLYAPAARDQLGSGTTRQRADALKNLAFQRERFNTEQLPLYVILQPLPDGSFKELARYEEGKINDIAGFAQFLRQPSPGS